MKNFEQAKHFFGERLQENVLLKNHTTSRVGGPARAFVSTSSAEELALDVQFLWDQGIPFHILGSGSNVLFSDQGIEAVVLLNRAKESSFESTANTITVEAESGTTLITLCRKAAEQGFAGLEWASTIPGTLGGALYGNAGAHGREMKDNLIMAEILHRETGRLSLRADQMDYGNRTSRMKQQPGNAVILSAKLALHSGDLEAIARMTKAHLDERRLTQPIGASMGSIFKNPPGDHAGRLIEAAGLKGTRIGGVEVSLLHANFMINDGSGSAEDFHRLIVLVQNKVREEFKVNLEPEIEIIGEWQGLA
ncbi:MAG: UDP-N-acetylmuramate dehydrogenase [Chloroflexi bacterium]|nr:UDP-N-acetylmuramate dehydrogenase [Chloroflexota bacterium]